MKSVLPWLISPSADCCPFHPDWTELPMSHPEIAAPLPNEDSVSWLPLQLEYRSADACNWCPDQQPSQQVMVELLDLCSDSARVPLLRLPVRLPDPCTPRQIAAWVRETFGAGVLLVSVRRADSGEAAAEPLTSPQPAVPLQQLYARARAAGYELRLYPDADGLLYQLYERQSGRWQSAFRDAALLERYLAALGGGENSEFPW